MNYSTKVCPLCGYPADAMIVDESSVSWCENGHVVVKDERVPAPKKVYDFSEKMVRSS